MSGDITIGTTTFSSETALLTLVTMVLAVLLIGALMAWRRAATQAEIAAVRADRAALVAEDSDKTRASEMQQRFADMTRVQSEITGQVKNMSERLDGLGRNVGQTVSETANRTQENLKKLGERLAVIDKAQQTITSLSSQVVELQHILANKQTRGAFGQGRMEAIVRDGLPASGYKFQPTLTNNTRPDCLILFPNGMPALVVDAKFPLEAWNLIREAASPEAVKAAEAQFRRDTLKHINDIAERYFVPGETQDTAFMFVPSESIFADIHEHFEDVIQKAHRARVVIVSPSLLMLSIQVVMSLLRDARMREQAHVIQDEVMKMMDDVGRLDERVRKLQTHFVQANKDIENIITSTKKVTGRGQRIASVELDDGEAPEVPSVKPPAKPAKPRPTLPELPFTQVEEV
ncbi:MAG: DNA recombination protein RmuC [Alphaproteobacteria bacterium]